MGTTDEAVAAAVCGERDRCLAIVEQHAADLRAIDLYPRLWNLINNPAYDPRGEPRPDDAGDEPTESSPHP